MLIACANAANLLQAPAFQAARTDLNLALAMVLLVGAGLMINSVLRLQQVKPGFDPTNVLNFDLSVAEGAPYVESLPGGDIERATPLVSAFYRQLLDKVTAIPGVESAGTVTRSASGITSPCWDARFHRRIRCP